MVSLIERWFHAVVTIVNAEVRVPGLELGPDTCSASASETFVILGPYLSIFIILGEIKMEKTLKHSFIDS